MTIGNDQQQSSRLKTEKEDLDDLLECTDYFFDPLKGNKSLLRKDANCRYQRPHPTRGELQLILIQRQCCASRGSEAAGNDQRIHIAIGVGVISISRHSSS